MENLLRRHRRDQLVDHLAEMRLRLRGRTPAQLAVPVGFEIVLDSRFIEHFRDDANVATAPKQERLDVASILGAPEPRPCAAFGGVASGLPPHDRAIVDVGRYCDLGADTYGLVN